MGQEKMEEAVRDSQLLSLGKILAGFSHELKNHLAIINESSGLMADILAMGEWEDQGLQEKFQRITGAIGDRVSQANQLVKHLNGFAHRMDTPSSTFMINEVLQEELALIARFAHHRKIDLQSDFGQGLPSLHANPSLVQFVVFAIITDLFSRMTEGGSISVSSRGEAGQVVVTLAADRLPEVEAEPSGTVFPPDIVDYAVEKMGVVRTDQPVDPHGHVVSLVFSG